MSESKLKSRPEVIAILNGLKKRNALKKMVEMVMIYMSEAGRVAVLVSRGMHIAQSLAVAEHKDESDIARDLFIIEYELLEATKPEIPSFTEIKADYIAFADYCIVSMPPDPTIEQQRAVWSDGLKKWEKSVRTWADLWAMWGEPCHSIFESGPEEEEGQSASETGSTGQGLIESATRIASGSETIQLRKEIRTANSASASSFNTADPLVTTPSGGVHPSTGSNPGHDTPKPAQSKSSKKKGGKAKNKGKGKA
ncbi:unnamed protein product [Peniophora sp. CBMAI 1063]|nr:unnamed protein product [Peniophora sp. CBMAI 1063]